MFKKIILSVVILFLVFFSGAFFSAIAEEGPLFRLRLRYDLSSDGILDSESIVDYSLAVPEILHYAGDKFILGGKKGTSGSGERFLRLLAAGIPLLIVENGISGASHEYGHFRAFSLFGFTEYEFADRENFNSRFEAAPWNAFTTQLGQIFGGKSYSATVSVRQNKEFWKDPSRSRYWREFYVILEAGGLNQNQLNAEFVGRKVLDGKSHLLDGITYFVNARYTATYPLGYESDITDYINALKKLGVETNANQIKTLSQLPKLASNSTLSYLLAIKNYVKDGDASVKPLSSDFSAPLRIYWPEFASYLSLYGPTIKTVERLEFLKSDLFHLYVTYERSLAKDVNEIGINLNFKIFGDLISLGPRLIYNDKNGNWFEFAADVRVFKEISFGIQVYNGHGYTFVREIIGRAPSFMEKNESGMKAFVTIALPY